ncbi:hypothetical protein LAHI110946_10105 [Lactococcus hircilactis]
MVKEKPHGNGAYEKVCLYYSTNQTKKEVNMELELVPLNRETGEIVTLDPSMVTSMNNADLQDFYANLKVIESLKKKAEAEIKRRLDEGQLFKRLSYGKVQYQRVLTLENEDKAKLVNKYGFECMVPLTINQLEKKYGESIYQELERFIVMKPKNQAIKWDD